MNHPRSKLGLVTPIVLVSLAGSAVAQTIRVSVTSNGTQASGNSSLPFLSGDGRYVAFHSSAPNLVPGDTNGRYDVFVHDLLNAQTELVSVDSNGVQGDSDSYVSSISADGRYVTFRSNADNLVAGDTGFRTDVFVRDRRLGSTERVSVDSGGVQGNDDSYVSSISADGRYVAFESLASNLVAGDTNGHIDVFVRDRLSGTTERVSVDSSGVQGNGDGFVASISADGRYVVFGSDSTNLVAGVTNGNWDVFVRDRQLGTTELVSMDSGGVQGNDESDAYDGSVSADGRYVAFVSRASNLVPGDTNGITDVFVHDRQTGATERVSVTSAGAQVSGAIDNASISANGRFVAFDRAASNLVPGDSNASRDLFVHDRVNGVTERVSVDSSGGEGNNHSHWALTSADGRFVSFYSEASNLVAGDTTGFPDVFVHDRNPTGYTSVCEPGSGGVITCPCLNPPSGAGRGCDNSSSTGGAGLAASGTAYISMDTLVFTTAGERQSALSIVMQGNGTVPGGVVYGQGVRCLGGTIIRRLFIKHAISGAITAPDFGAGDPTVSARSAAKGDVIQAGQSRWYLVYYRDPTVLGSCPASRTFNATQTGQVTWWY